MSSKNISGGSIAGSPGGLAVQFSDDYWPDAVLTAQFTATGATSAVPMPAGVVVASLRTFVFGAPTAATVLVQGSRDGGATWVTMPGTASLDAARYTLLRLNCTALAGGTSPAIVAVAVATP